MTSPRFETSQWAHWLQTPLPGDASARRYFYLTKPNAPRVILMRDPPAPHKNGSVVFENIANALRAQGLAAPAIYFHDPETGTMVIEDLGATDFASFLTDHPTQEGRLYAAAAQVSKLVSTIDCPLGTADMNHVNAAEMVNIAATHYAQNDALCDDLRGLIQLAFDANVSHDRRLALRDFHAENLIWRPEKSDHQRVGLLDFQDACYAPIGYDLMSLLRDIRRGVSATTAADLMADFQSENHLSDAHLACVGAQRNLRILGVFARLSTNGKPQYLRYLPAVWQQLQIDLAHPALLQLNTFVTTQFPAPDAAYLKGLAVT